MQIIRNLHQLSNKQPCVATIGNFDGVHLGHQTLLKNLIAHSQSMLLPSTVIIFEPQPQEYFKDDIPARLTNLREKLANFKILGIERVLLLRFNSHFVTMPAETFIEQILVRSLNIRCLLIGDDFRFGKWRRGDFQLLHDNGCKYGFEVKNTSTVHALNERISSTKIRQALIHADLTTVTQLLGRPYRLCGKVIHGAKRGRILGFPTANINLRRRISPIRGVYGVRVFGEKNKVWYGVANIGCRPTISGKSQILLEVHLLGFNGNLYHTYLSVEPVLRLRDEQRFANLEALQQQIAQDVIQAKELLNSHPNTLNTN